MDFGISSVFYPGMNCLLRQNQEKLIQYFGKSITRDPQCTQWAVLILLFTALREIPVV